MKIVFMSAGALILFAIASVGPKGYFETEAYLRMYLEYTYAQIIFVLTDHIQSMLEMNPNLDLRSMLGTTDVTMRNILDQIGPLGDCASFFTTGVEVIGPIACEVRDTTSNILCSACNNNMDVIYAILSVKGKLFNIIQPSNPDHRLRHSDLIMLLNFVRFQTIGTELWFPVCLPRLSKTGFLFAYHSCINEGTNNLNLTLISHKGSTEQFSQLQEVALNIKKGLGVENKKENVLRIYNLKPRQYQQKDGTRTNLGGDEDVNLLWERTESGVTNDNEKVHCSSLGPNLKDTGRNDREEIDLNSPILKSVDVALKADLYETIIKNYCKIASTLHFLFCFDAPLQHYKTGKPTGGSFAQCFNTPLLQPLNEISKNRLWSIYQRLSLRLRLGCASVCVTIDALNEIMDVNNSEGINCEDFPALCLQETALPPGRLLYTRDGNELFFALSGEGGHLYATLPGSIGPVDATQVCQKLLATLINDKDNLFLARPLAF